MTRQFKTGFMKVAVSISAIALVTAIVALTSARTQSRFVEASLDGAPVFIDKYVSEPLRAEFTAGMGYATYGFLAEAGLIGAKPKASPVAYFAADRHYGVVSAGDPLVKKRLRGRPSSDFVLFRSISANFYANELVSKSVAAQDGSYAFVNIDDHWRQSLLHAYVHAIDAANAPEAVKAALRVDSGFDPAVSQAFRFIDETFALLSSDLFGLMRPEGGVEAAWSSFESKTAARYADPDSDIARQEAEILMITYDLPQKSAEFYSACNAFASSLMRQYGREAIQAASKRLMSGDYRSLDDLFSAMGGLSAAITSWKGDPSVPR